jgi:polysaccharide biosynthesis transport protein
MQAQRSRLGSAHPEAQSLNRQFADGERALKAEIARVVASTDADQHAASEQVTTLEGVAGRGESGGTKRRQGADPAECHEP